jgi:hypothetical protein
MLGGVVVPEVKVTVAVAVTAGFATAEAITVTEVPPLGMVAGALYVTLGE